MSTLTHANICQFDEENQHEFSIAYLNKSFKDLQFKVIGGVEQFNLRLYETLKVACADQTKKISCNRVRSAFIMDTPQLALVYGAAVQFSVDIHRPVNRYNGRPFEATEEQWRTYQTIWAKEEQEFRQKLEKIVEVAKWQKICE